MTSRHGDDYLKRVNRAIDHVVRHLDRSLRLEELAAVADFSPFHFHRVFKSVVGEPLGRFVKRLRLERALYLMSHDPERPLTSIALACGFASSSDFSRSFRGRYECPPSEFDLDEWRATRRDELNDVSTDVWHAETLTRLSSGENPDGFEVTLRDLPPRTMAYVRVFDPYRSERAVVDAAERLVAWAEARGVADRRWYGYQWEDPEVVPLADCRYDVAVEVDDVEPEGAVGRFDFPAMRVAEVVLDGDIDLEQRALDWLFGTWLPASGYVPDEQPCFEAWHGRRFADGMTRFRLAAQLPVRLPNHRPPTGSVSSTPRTA